MKQRRSVSVNVGPTIFAGDIRGHKIYGDVGTEYGGHDVAMMPSEGLLVVFGNCLGMEIALACRNKGIPYEGMTVEVEADYEEERHWMDNFRVTVYMPTALDERTRRTVQAGAGLCTVHNTLLRHPQIAVTIAEPDSPPPQNTSP
jgi:uncharacterized OsmC-like protein